MDSFLGTQSDLEVIIEFLEEYHKQSTGGNAEEVWTDIESFEPCWMCYEPSNIKPAHATTAPLPPLTTTALCDRGSQPNTAVGSGGKMRLFHFLFEMLEDPNMAHCVSWVPPAASGVFRFSSTNKDQVAALWGQRKGNKRPMTYQKMSRALRNYARSGEIFKVKRKLTYRFSQSTLTSLQSHRDSQCRFEL